MLHQHPFWKVFRVSLPCNCKKTENKLARWKMVWGTRHQVNWNAQYCNRHFNRHDVLKEFNEVFGEGLGVYKGPPISFGPISGINLNEACFCCICSLSKNWCREQSSCKIRCPWSCQVSVIHGQDSRWQDTSQQLPNARSSSKWYVIYKFKRHHIASGASSYESISCSRPVKSFSCQSDSRRAWNSSLPSALKWCLHPLNWVAWGESLSSPNT